MRALFSVITASLLCSTLLNAEPIGSFGVNQSWNQPLMQRVKHKDAFGDTYYTFVKEKPSKCVEKEVHRATQNIKKASQDILDGFYLTLKAIEELQKGSIDSAKKELQNALTLFERALKADPSLKLVPIDTTINVAELHMPLKQIKKDLLQAQALLDSFHTQAARELLMPMKDEIDITTYYLPLDLYTKAIKRALAFLQKEKKNKALQELASGIDTIVASTITIPIALLKADEYLKKAAKIAQKDPKKALSLIQLAQKKSSIRVFCWDIAICIPKSIQNSMSSLPICKKSLWQNITLQNYIEEAKKSSSKLLNKFRLESKSTDSVWRGTAKAHKKAQEEELNGKLRFIKKMETDIF